MPSPPNQPSFEGHVQLVLEGSDRAFEDPGAFGDVVQMGLEAEFAELRRFVLVDLDFEGILRTGRVRQQAEGAGEATNEWRSQW